VFYPGTTTTPPPPPPTSFLASCTAISSVLFHWGAILPWQYLVRSAEQLSPQSIALSSVSCCLVRGVVIAPPGASACHHHHHHHQQLLLLLFGALRRPQTFSSYTRRLLAIYVCSSPEHRESGHIDRQCSVALYRQYRLAFIYPGGSHVPSTAMHSTGGQLIRRLHLAHPLFGFFAFSYGPNGTLCSQLTVN
jgi:hypothetical protein